MAFVEQRGFTENLPESLLSMSSPPIAFEPHPEADTRAPLRAAGPGMLHTVTPALAVAAVYCLTAWAGMRLPFPGTQVSALWLGNAILLATLLLVPRRQWWMYLLFCFAARLLVSLPVREPSTIAAVIQYAANCSTALVGALVLPAIVPGLRRIDCLRTALALILVGGVLAPLSSSVLLSTLLGFLNHDDTFWLTTLARTLTNSFAILTIVPIALHAAAWIRGAEHSVRPARVLEAGLLAVSLFTLGTLGLIAPNAAIEHSAAFLYLPFALLLWAAVRFGVAGSAASALLLGILAICGQLYQIGPFVSESPNQSAISVSLFLVLISMTMLLLPAALEERAALERADALSHARFRTIFEGNIMPTVIWRSGGAIVDANASFFELTGYRRADLLGGRLLAHELLVSTMEVTGKPAVLNQDSNDGPIECELVTHSGRRIPVLTCHNRFPGSSGDGTAHILDLSSLRRAESARRQSDTLHSAVLASIHDQIAVLDQDGVIIETNQSWRRFVEESDSQWFQRAYVGSQYLEICAAAALSGDAIAAELLKATGAVLTGLTARQRMEFSHAATEASQRWYEISIERLQRAEGGAVVSCADITAEKRAMSEAREQRRQLAHLGRAAMLGELSGAFAHELAQPLTSILGNAEAALQLLPQRDDLGEIREILRDIINDDMRAAEVITRLRSMLTQGEIHREPVDLNQVVQEVLALARSDLVTRNVAVRLQLEPHDALVHADRVQMQQVVLNLIVNACEAMSEVPSNERQVCISTRNFGGAELECAVADRGRGIAEGQEERIFQPFVTSKKQGLGLGLAICRSIVEAHDGRLWAENAPGGGAIVRFTTKIGI